MRASPRRPHQLIEQPAKLHVVTNYSYDESYINNFLYNPMAEIVSLEAQFDEFFKQFQCVNLTSTNSFCLAWETKLLHLS